MNKYIGKEFIAVKQFPFEEMEEGYDVLDGEKVKVVSFDPERGVFKLENLNICNWFEVSESDLLKIIK